MNNTNRALNRILLLIIGTLLLALGAASIVITAWPGAADGWIAGTQRAQQWLENAVDASAIAGSAASWFAVGIVAIVVAVCVALVLALTRLGRRRSRMVLRISAAQNPRGRVTVTEAFVSDALQNAFDRRDDILFARVTSNDIRRQSVMHVSVSPRQNASPRTIVDDVDRLVSNLAALTGQEVPTYISVHSGLRTALARDQRRLR